MADTPQKRSFFYEEHKKKLVCELNKYFFNNELVDVTLVCNGGKIQAHQVVLAAFSPFLKDAFCDISTAHPILMFHTVPKNVMLALVRFMYNGEIEVAPELLPSVLQTAKELEIGGFENENHEDASQNSAIFNETPEDLVFSDGVDENVVEKNNTDESHQIVLNPFAKNANGIINQETHPKSDKLELPGVHPNTPSPSQSDDGDVEIIENNISTVLVVDSQTANPQLEWLGKNDCNKKRSIDTLTLQKKIQPQKTKKQRFESETRDSKDCEIAPEESSVAGPSQSIKTDISTMPFSELQNYCVVCEEFIKDISINEHIENHKKPENVASHVCRKCSSKFYHEIMLKIHECP